MPLVSKKVAPLNPTSCCSRRYSAPSAASGSITLIPPGVNHARRMMCQISGLVNEMTLTPNATEHVAGSVDKGPLGAYRLRVAARLNTPRERR